MVPFIVATLISLLSVAVLKWRVGDLFPIKLGERQIYYKEAGPGKKCSSRLKVLAGTTNEIKILTYNFPKSEYSKGRDFRETVENWRKKGVNIKLIGGPEVEAEEDILELAKKGILDVRKTKKPRKEHIVIVDNPPQLWVEKNHTGELAKNIYYTDQPYPAIFQKSNDFFDSLWLEGTAM